RRDIRRDLVVALRSRLLHSARGPEGRWQGTDVREPVAARRHPSNRTSCTWQRAVATRRDGSWKAPLRVDEQQVTEEAEQVAVARTRVGAASRRLPGRESSTEYVEHPEVEGE